MTPLGREIAELIAADGPISVARYMALCLGHPVHGYYAARDPFGAAGDFTTAPEISQIFGELIGLWCGEVWRQMGAPARVALVELGPGRGTLMADLLRAARAVPGFLDAIEVTLVEMSPALRAVQEKALGAAGAPVRWAATVEEALSTRRHPGRSGEAAESRDRPENCGGFPDDGPGSPLRSGRDDGFAIGPPLPAIVVANEFFDALPIRQFVRTPAGWRERMVGLDGDGALSFGLAPAAPSDVRLPPAPIGATIEIGQEARITAARLGAALSIRGGAALAIDYGAAVAAGDTLQAVRRHRFVDPLEEPGEADLTTHVDFGALAAAATSAGAAAMALIDQADFLDRLGAATRAAKLAEHASPAQAAAIAAGLARLTDRTPTGMGALFKVLAFGDPRLGALPGCLPVLR